MEWPEKVLLLLELQECHKVNDVMCVKCSAFHPACACSLVNNRYWYESVGTVRVGRRHTGVL